MIRFSLKNAVACLLLLAAFTGYAQSSATIDTRITEVYGDYVSVLSQDQLAILSHNLQRSSVEHRPVSAQESYPKLSSLYVVTKYRPELKMEPVFDPQHINPLKYTINFTLNTDLTYRIDGTDYVLVVRKKD